MAWMDGAQYRVVPRYGVSQAALLVRVSPPTLRRWRAAPVATARRRRDPIIQNEAGTGGHRWRLSFVQLAQAMAAQQLRSHEVLTGKIREALAVARDDYGIDYVLFNEGLMTDGHDLFLLQRGHCTGLTGREKGQTNLVPVIREYLTQIEFRGATPVRIYLDKDHLAVVDPLVMHGEPVLAGTRVLLSTLNQRFHLDHEPVQSIAFDLGLNPSSVEQVVTSPFLKAIL